MNDFPYVQYLPLIASSQNIHEIIWNIDEIGGEKIEGRYFSTLGYPVKLTNASGYMSYPLINGLYIFIDGIENEGQECKLLANTRLREILGVGNSTGIECMMTAIRQIASSIRKARVNSDMPIKQSLQSVRLIGHTFKGTHIHSGSCPMNPKKNDMYNIILDTKLTPFLLKEGEIRKKHREAIMKRKQMGGG